jgi:hypothetical protein
MMKNLLESFRSYSLLAEEQLLIEARTDDAAAKYPEIAKKREELDGESLLDVLIEADPSGNHKYLMNAARLLQRSMDDAEQTNDYEPFWGKQWPDDAGDNMYSPWGVAKNIASTISKYHKLQSYIRDHDEKFKDLKNVASYSQLQTVVTGAQNTKIAITHAKEEKKRASKKAYEESIEVDDNDHHKIIRPLSEHASCYYGQSTTWCISATKAMNYFDTYTKDGKSFYFLLAKRKDVDDNFKIMAVVFDREGDVEEYFTEDNDSMGYNQFRDAIRQTLVGMTVSNQMVSMEEDEPYEKAVILDEMEKWKGINNFDFERSEEERDPSQLVMMFSDFIVSSYISKIEEMMKTTTQENPAGTSDEEYEEKLREYEFDHLHIELSFPSETGSEYVYWTSSATVDVEMIVDGNQQRLIWKMSPEQLEENEEELTAVVKSAVEDSVAWPEEFQRSDHSPLDYYATLDTGAGDLDEFETFLDQQRYYEDSMDSGELAETLLDQLQHAGFLGRNEREEGYWPNPEEKEKQLELPLQENRFRIKIIKNRS